jgi:hypothetical protein
LQTASGRVVKIAWMMSFLSKIPRAFGEAILQPDGLSPQGFSGRG